MSEPVLRPCPFCGGSVRFRKALWPSDGCTDAVIHAGPSDCGLADFSIDTIDEGVIAAWNVRSTGTDAMTAPADHEVEAVRAALATRTWWTDERDLARRIIAALDAVRAQRGNRNWLKLFREYGHHKHTCDGTDGSRCACGYLDYWQEAWDLTRPRPGVIPTPSPAAIPSPPSNEALDEAIRFELTGNLPSLAIPSTAQETAREIVYSWKRTENNSQEGLILKIASALTAAREEGRLPADWR